MATIKNLLDREFGFLVVIAAAGKDKFGGMRWRCLCVCGKEIIAKSGKLIQRRKQSCGCKTRVLIGAATTRHGATKNGEVSPEYRAFENAKGRCRNPRDKNFKHYGGRGIRFKFKSFSEFIHHIGKRPIGLTLDRISNDGNYELGNVRWATRLQQSQNRRMR